MTDQPEYLPLDTGDEQTCIVLHHIGPTDDLGADAWHAYAIGPFPSEEIAKAFHATIPCQCNKLIVALTVPPFTHLVLDAAALMADVAQHVAETQRKDMMN